MYSDDDEVHCCSQWGHDFRTDYLSLSLLKGQFPGVPILGLTATATPNVLVDIQKILQIPEAVIFTAPYNRPNLFYEVRCKPEAKTTSINFLADKMKNVYTNQSGIIYALTQKECEDLATDLRQKGLKVSPYHANLDGSVKSNVHKKWTENYYQAVVATVAFGMGIDKPDVRFVIHYSVPKTLEGLYQESGRAGRDGKKANCIVMFSLNDWLRNYCMTQNKREEDGVMSVLRYCINVAMCRRKIISKYFDDDWRSSDCQRFCDHCAKGTITLYTYDIISCLRDIVELINIASTKEVNLTLKKLVEAWLQIGPKNLQLVSKSKPKFTRENAEHIIAFLLANEYLVVRRGYSLVQTLAYVDTHLEHPLDSKQFGGQILMEYHRSINGVRVILEKKVNSTEEGPKNLVQSSSKASGEKTENSKSPTCRSLVDLTQSDSDCSEKVRKPVGKRSLDSDSDSSSESLRPVKKNRKGQLQLSSSSDEN